MAERSDETTEVVRARRVEVVDEAGRLRLVLGALDAHDGSPLPGLALLDAEGRRRAWLVQHEAGVSLSFDRGGNIVLEMGVLDGGPDEDPDAYVVVCDEAGARVAELRGDA